MKCFPGVNASLGRFLQNALTATSRALVLRGTFAPNLFVEVSVLHAFGNLSLQQVEVEEAVILFDPAALFPGHSFPSCTAAHPDRLGPRGIAPGGGHRAQVFLDAGLGVII